MRYLITLILLFISTNIATASGDFIKYKVDGEPFEGYFISPAKEAPLVLLVHDWDGLTDYEVKRAEMLAGLGYAVFAVDLFGDGIRPSETEERRKLTSALYSNRPRMRTLLNAAFEKAKELGANYQNSIAMGYCFGGAAVLEFARSGVDLKGFVTFHGGLTTPEGQDYSGTKGKLLILHGTADTSVTMEHFAKLAEELEKQHVNHEMVSYSGAPHAFTVFGSSRYHEEADKKSWQRFTEYLKETL